MRARRSRRRGHGEEGQVVVWFVAMSVITLAIIAFGVDLGFLYNARRVAQNAADAGATAGATELPGCGDQDPDPLLLSEDYAGKKNLNPTEGRGYSVPGGDQYDDPSSPYHASYGTYTVDDPVFSGESTFETVYQRVLRQQNMIFARFLGIGKKNVPAEAEAACLPIKSGNICPFWIAGDPNQPVIDADDDGTPETAYGLTLGAVYSMKFNSAQGVHRGALSAPPGDNNSTNDWVDFLSSGCEKSNGSDDPFYSGTGEEVPNKPGNYSNPFLDALEGGGIADPPEGLYGVEKTESGPGGLYPNKHLDCNIKITYDLVTGDGLTAQNYGYVSGVWQPTGPILNLQDPDPAIAAANRETVVEWINQKTVPSEMAADFNSPCGGETKEGPVNGPPPEPDVIHPATQGRFMHVAMVDQNDPCVEDADNPAGCDIGVLGILTMYVVCWTNQEEVSDDNWKCVPDVSNSANYSIFGVFANFRQGNLIGGDGVSQCEICPKRIRLVR